MIKFLTFLFLLFSFFAQTANSNQEIRTKDGWKFDFNEHYRITEYFEKEDTLKELAIFNDIKPKNLLNDQEYIAAYQYKLEKKITPEQLAIAREILLLELYVLK